MQFIDLKSQYHVLEEKITGKIKNVFDHGKFIQGPEVHELEEGLKEYVASSHCIAVANGTDALEIAQKAINIQPHDEVILPSYTWVSTAETVRYLGATPVYCDVCEKTFNVDIEDIKKRITQKTKAIVAVSLFGQCADLLELREICDLNNIVLIEDAAQSFGATHFGRKSCGIAHISTTSFFPSKPLGCYGDGGAIFTDNDDLANKMRLLANHGKAGPDNFELVGRNSRLDTIQAAILLAKLEVLDQEVNLRNQIHKIYSQNIDPDIATPPFIKDCNLSVFAQYTLKVDTTNRDRIISNFNKDSIPYMCYYQMPIYKQKAYFSNTSELPVTDSLAKNTVSIPMAPYLSKNDLDRVIQAINK